VATQATKGFAVLADLAPGTALGVSGWYTVMQTDIDEFAKLTRDEDPFHIDPAFAQVNSPVGATIAFGFQTLAMLTYFSHQVFGALGIAAEAGQQVFNFGFNRVRMPEPVPAGSRIRGHFTFAGARKRESGGLELRLDTVVEIDGRTRPALVAEWLFVVVGD